MNITLVIGKQQTSARKGYDHTDDAHQSSPYRQGKQDNGGVQSCDFSHHLGYDNGILDELYHAEYQKGAAQNPPEVLAGIGSLQKSQQDGRDERYELQIRYQVQNTDEQAEADGQWEVDDQEADTEQDAHTERYERLAAEVTVHAVLYIGHDTDGHVTVFHGHQFDPAVGNGFIVKQDEESVQQDDEGGKDADNDVHRLGEKRPYLRQDRFQGLGKVGFVQGILNLQHVNMLLDEVGYRSRNGSLFRTFNEVFGQQDFQFAEFLNDGRNQAYKSKHCKAQQGEHYGQDGQYPTFQSEPMLEKEDDGVDEVGNEPSHQERQQDVAQLLHDIQDADDDGAGQDASDETVESDFLLYHSGEGVGSGTAPSFCEGRGEWFRKMITVCLPGGPACNIRGRAVRSRPFRPAAPVGRWR